MGTKRRGPRPDYESFGGKVCVVQTQYGETGILHDKTNDTYYYYLPQEDGKRIKKNLGRHIEKAAPRFYQEVQSKDIVVKWRYNRRLDPKYIKKHPGYNPEIGQIETAIDVNDLSYWERVKKDLLERPMEVARMTGVEAVSRLQELVYSKPIRIGDLFKFYLERADKPVKTKKRGDYTSWWAEFLKTTGLKDSSPIEHINRIAVNKWYDWLSVTRDKESYSPSWINHRIIMLHVILTYNKRRIDNNQEIMRSFEIIKDVCRTAAPSDPNPQPITVENFWKLYKAANEYWKMILLLGLSSGSYFKDLYDIEWKNISLTDGTLSMIRQKTNIGKCCVLFPELVEMLKAYRAKRRDTLPWLLLSNNKSRYGVLSMQSYFKRVLRPKAGVDDSVKFNHLRDAVKTYAEEAKCRSEDVALVMGWKLSGVQDRYYKRNPENTRQVIESIRNVFQVSQHVQISS